MTTLNESDDNPFVGPSPIPSGSPIFGRTREIADLRDTVVSGRIVLLYSPSGAGKSSLLEAGLRPQLADRGFHVLPTIRVGDEIEHDAANRYAASALLSLERAQPTGRPLERSELWRTDLSGYLDQIESHDAATAVSRRRGARTCLIFDQFEELFTADPIDLDDKRAFLRDLGDALRDRRCWAVFAMREDFIAHLDPYAALLPTGLRTRMRLDLLSPAAATAAVIGTASVRETVVEEEAARRLVDGVRRVRVQRGSTSSNELGPDVEPVVLQVVCRRLWDDLTERADGVPISRITADDVDTLGDADRALADFCDQQMWSAADASATPEVVIRDWVEADLITEQGFRDQTQEGPGDHGPDVLTALEAGHFIRPETRRGQRWFEIAHDRLTEPMIASNRRWRRDHLTDVERQARQWNHRDRPKALLLRDELLTDAERDSAILDEVDPVVREFLAASRTERDEQTAATRRLRRDRIIALAAGGIALAAGAATVLAVVFWLDARSARTDAEEALLAAETAKAEVLELSAQLTASTNELDSAQERLAQALESARSESGDSPTELDDPEVAAAQAEVSAAQASVSSASAALTAASQEAAADEDVASGDSGESDDEGSGTSDDTLSGDATDEVELADARSVAADARALADEAIATAIESRAAIIESPPTDEELTAVIDDRRRAIELEIEATTAALDVVRLIDPDVHAPEVAARESLVALAGEGGTRVEAHADRWVPQISSKRPGVPDETWQFERILAEHEQLRTQFDALLLASGSHLSYGNPTFWVTIADASFADPEGALQWCVAEGRGPEDCFAKLITDDHTLLGNTAVYQ